MTIFNKIIRQALLMIPLLGFAVLAQAQSATVQVINNTSCDVYVRVYGAVTAGNCSGPGSNAIGVAAAGATTTLGYSGSGLYYNVGATSVYSGSIPHPNAPYGTWAWAVHPLQTCVGAVNFPGDSPCGGYFLSIVGGNVVVN